MRLKNPLTKFQADHNYLAKGFTRRDINDNSVEDIIIGESSNIFSLQLQYAIIKPIANHAQQGMLYFTLNDPAYELDHEYVYAPPEIVTIDFNPSVVGSNLVLNITTSGIGENPIFYYKILNIEEV